MTLEFAEKNILPLFPSVVWTHDLKPADFQPLNRQLAQDIAAILEPRPPRQPGLTWQTHQDLHRRPEFQEIVACFTTAVQGVIEFLQIEPLPFQITGCWANVNPDGSPHSPHTHANNYLSGVYYVQSGPGANSITFHDPRDGLYMISPVIRQETPYNARHINVDAKEGRLVIFPAWLKHSVEPNQSGQERISISFNIMFSDFADRVSPPRWQGIGSKA